ncbi:class II fructose-bisphosphate aldolase [Bacteriovoracaceae bacterium]|nr:class II fructose-bisphosphate aldolase [Bacteriovoracaceae bacterium]
MRQKSLALLQTSYRQYGIAAYNVFNLEQILGVFKGANDSTNPVLFQLTPYAHKYVGFDALISTIDIVSKTYPNVDFGIHLDHGTPEACLYALEENLDFDSIMIDLSHESFARNVTGTREIVQLAHRKGISVEAELGVLSGTEDELSVDATHTRFTDPNMAQQFIEQTDCDSLAISVGTSHGAYKFASGDSLNLPLIAEIASSIPNVPLVLHGASKVDIQEIDRINKTGGQLDSKAACGLKNEDLQASFKLGIAKVNIATDIRLLWTRVHREHFQKSPENIDPVVPGQTFIDTLAKFVAKKQFIMNPKLQGKIDE